MSILATHGLTKIYGLEYIFPASGTIVGLAAGLLFGAAAAVIPARQAAGMPIVAALRYE